ncbi:OmpA family protein [Flavobacterium hibisci]|uniref:OmpA family protein n=1 Tax=Flavobacterium hibisci TaxID=1914462 RepID=UPI001CC17180|nr:OmpA family protein [Flavobacterium hibisci]MBZ4042652.1 OmpA family protein [Flavobacterium hibisci]
MAKGVKKIKWTGEGKVSSNLSIPNKKAAISPNEYVFFEVDQWYDGTPETDKKKNITWIFQDFKAKTIILQKTLSFNRAYGIKLPKNLCGQYEYYLEASLSGKRDLINQTGLKISGYCPAKIVSSKWCTTNDGKDVRKSHLFNCGETVYLNLVTEGLNGNLNLSVDVFRKSDDGKTPVFRYTSVDVIDGEINLEIKNTYSWYAKLKGVKETEEFYVKVFDPAHKLYILNDKNETIHARFLKINKKVVSKEVKPPTNMSPLKTGEPDKNAARFEPCKFETITIIEDKKEDGKISKIKTIIFDNGKKLADQVLTKEPIRKAILFEFDKYVITPEGKTLLNNTLQFLLEHQFSTVKIDGHACVIGKENYNQKLSQQRSDAVKKVFVDGGLDSRLITSVGHGEVNPTDDKQARDNLKYRDEKEYKRNRCVDISFNYYAHDAQTIVHETIAPSLDKNITIDITEYQNKACFREKGKHKKNIKITSPEYTKSIDTVTNKLDFPIKSNLAWWNISPLKYIWPKVFPNNYNIHVHSCRYFSNDENSTVSLIVYPDIKWTLEFSFNFSNSAAYTHGNLPEYSRKISPQELKYQKSLNEKELAQRLGDLQRVKELTRNMREAQSKAVSVGKENARLEKNSPEMLSKFELKLIAEWDDKREKRELGFEFAEKLRKVLNIFLKYKKMADKVQDTLGGFPKGAALSKTPFIFEIQSPSLNASISWYLEKGQDNLASQIATVGTLNFKADPLMGANFIIDLLALGSRMHPAVAAMVTGAQVALSALHGGITFEAKFYGSISFDFKAVEINSLTGIKGGNLDLGAKVGIQVTLDIQFEVKSKVWSADVIVKLRANVKADAHFAAKILFDSDKKGIYAKPEIGFSGLIITLKAELVINGFKKTLQISNEGEPFLKSDIAKFDPIYIF